MAVKQTTKDFVTTEFFETRDLIATGIRAEVTKYLELEGLTVQQVHIGQIVIPNEFEEAVTTKVVTQQEAATVLMERNVTLVEARTAVITAEADADAAVIIGQSTAEAKILVQQAINNGTELIQTSMGEALSLIQTDLAFTVKQVLEYKHARMIASLGSMDEVIVGFENDFLSVKERT
jgi:regulator of protease activity HflC (stomatin/prohibitin superfamily)